MIAFILSITADPSLGRIDKYSLSQQTLMELLIEGFTSNKKKIVGNIDNPNDISRWTSLEFDDDKITHIRWHSQSLQGSIELKWMPLSCKTVGLGWNMLSGNVDLTCLPDGLRFLTLNTNRFEGTIDLTRLPASMQELYLQENDFRGMTDFSRLPRSLIRLKVSDTRLEGEVFEFSGLLVTTNSNVKDKRRKIDT